MRLFERTRSLNRFTPVHTWGTPARAYRCRRAPSTILAASLPVRSSLSVRLLCLRVHCVYTYYTPSSWNLFEANLVTLSIACEIELYTKVHEMRVWLVERRDCKLLRFIFFFFSFAAVFFRSMLFRIVDPSFICIRVVNANLPREGKIRNACRWQIVAAFANVCQRLR